MKLAEKKPCKERSRNGWNISRIELTNLSDKKQAEVKNFPYMQLYTATS